jgi:hypothetical protein
LRAKQFSFQAKTIRVYSEAGGEPLHIFHTMEVTVHRPNRLLMDVAGDDGSNKLLFDGKTLTIYSGWIRNTRAFPYQRAPQSTGC